MIFKFIIFSPDSYTISIIIIYYVILTVRKINRLFNLKWGNNFLRMILYIFFNEFLKIKRGLIKQKVRRGGKERKKIAREVGR